MNHLLKNQTQLRLYKPIFGLDIFAWKTFWRIDVSKYFLN